MKTMVNMREMVVLLPLESVTSKEYGAWQGDRGRVEGCVS